MLGAQMLVLKTSFAVHRVRSGRRPTTGYVVGMEEIAGLLTAFGSALDDSVTVNLTANPLYRRKYDVSFDLGGRWSLAKRVRRLVVAPWVLGRLAARRTTFIYIGAEGFLLSLVDGRDRELAFLRKHGRVVVCYFTGSDIRSYALMNAFGRRLGRDVLTTYEPLVSPGIDSDASEDRRRLLALTAERRAHLVFNATVDQMSYFTEPTEACLYFFPDERIARRPQKWIDVKRPVIVHAPTSPAIKGTPLVRAALRRLREEGYDFEYVELSNQPNEDVLAALDRAHIVLNQFYAFIPGVFGIEAMAANTVMLASADGDLEPSLPQGANDAWVVTAHWQVYDHLKAVLDQPGTLQAQADRGTEWVRANCSRSVDTRRLHALLASVSLGAGEEWS